MGQRHQAFIVARILPHGSTDGKAYYRCIGAVHHQWCFGSLPLQAALRFFALVKNPANAAIIREELKSAQGKFGRFGKKPDLPRVPCPYSTFLLVSSYKIDLERNYVSGAPLVHDLVPASRGCWDTDNNDGLSILDITDPLNPRYAFVMGSEPDTDLGDEPCTAEDYVRGYYPHGDEDDDGEKLHDMISKFDPVPFLTEEMLAEAWPTEFGPSKSLNGRRPATRKSVPNSIPETPAQPVDDSGPAPADLVVEPVVTRSLELGNTDEVEAMIPSKSSEIKQVLFGRSPFPDGGIPLLVSVLQQEFKNGTIDLTGLTLSPEQLASVVSKFEDVRIVILSQSPSVQVDHIRSLLTAKPEINRLELLNTGITNKSFASLLEEQPDLFKRVSDIVHPLFYSLKPHANPGTFHVFASQADSHIHYGGPATPGLVQGIPLWSPAKIVQNIVDFMSILIKDGTEGADYIQTVLIPTALSAGLRKPGTLWSDATLPMLASSLGKLHVGGWVFLFKQANRVMSSMGNGSSESKYAFAKVLPSKTGVQVYDIKGFLENMEREGRGPLPNSDLVQEFEDLVQFEGQSGTSGMSDYRGGTIPQAMAFIVRAMQGGIASISGASRALSTSLFSDDEASKFVASFVSPDPKDGPRLPKDFSWPSIVI